MTTEELILGHFDGTLTPAEESRLRAEMNASPEVRALFEQHRSLHSMLSADAASLAPSSRLDKAVVAAALSTVPETIGSGALSWLTGKVAVGLSAVVVAGISVAILSNSGSEPAAAPVQSAPATTVAPALPAPAAPSVIESPKSDEVRVAQEPKGEAPKRSSSVSASENPGKSDLRARKAQRKPLRIDTSDNPTIEHPVEIQPDGGK